MEINNVEIWQPGFVLGMKWNQASSSPALTRIDMNGNTLSSLPYSLDEHPIWSNIRRCTLTEAGYPTYGTNARGDGLTLDGSTGRVMVSVPRFYAKAEKTGDVFSFWVSPSYIPGFTLFPSHVQRGGTVRDEIYVGAYDAVLANDKFPLHTGTVATLHSYTSQQPWTGYDAARADGMTELPFDTGDVEFTIGETLTGVTGGAVGTVVDWIVTSGTWVGNDAAGKVWLKQQSAVNYQAENLTGSIAGVACAAATGVQSNLTLTQANARTYSTTNINSRWGFMNVWTHAALKLLYLIEHAHFDSQSLTNGIGQGVVNKASGTGFAGEETGSDSSDTNVATNGTGHGTGTDGLTHIVWRGIEDLWGNVWQFVDGFEAKDSPDNYRIIKRDGGGAFANPMAGGDYETSVAVPITADGYISNLVHEDLLKFLMLPSAVVGSSSTYLCDYIYAHNAGETNILLAGGSWYYGDKAGVGVLTANNEASDSYRYIGARLEFI
jgi:hypothetical protein